MSLLIEAVLRSCLLTASVWLALKLLRLRNPHLAMGVWSGVVAACLMMPLLMQSAPTRVLPVPGEVYRAWDAAMAPIGMPASLVSGAERAAESLSWTTFLLPTYLLIAALLATRLLVGLTQGLRLVHRADRVDAAWASGRDVRVSTDITVPLTFGHTILLPVDFLGWDAPRQSAVLAHEASHAERGDFYILLMAALHRTLFWINPAAWWLENMLVDLAEARSDAAALATLEDRLFYAEILVDLAGRARPLSAGVAMARHATVRRRVERILSESTIPARPTLKALALMVVCLVLAASIAAGATIEPDASEAMVKQRLAEQARPRAAITLENSALEKFIGYYALAGSPEFPLKVTRQDGHLWASAIGHPALEYFPESDHKFFIKEGSAQDDFQIDPAGRITTVVLHQNGYELPAYRLDEATGQGLEKALADRVAANVAQLGSEAALRSHIGQVQRGEIDETTLAVGMAEGVRAMLPRIRAAMVALGPITSVQFEGVSPGGADIYAVTHFHGARRWQIRLTHDGRIESMGFGS